MSLSYRQQLAIGLGVLIGLAAWMWAMPHVVTGQARSPIQVIEPDLPAAETIATWWDQPATCDRVDLNRDGEINVIDLALMGLRAGESKAIDLQVVALIGLCYNAPSIPGYLTQMSEQTPLAIADIPAAVTPLANLGVSPHSSQVNVNQIFEVSIAISTNVPTRAAQFGLNFDPAIVRCDAINEGPFYREWAQAHGGSTVIFLTPTCNNTQGVVSDMGVLIFGTEAGGPQGNGTVARVRFTAIAEGLSPLNLTHVQVFDGAISPQPLPAITANGQVIVGVVPGGQMVNVDIYATVASANFIYLPLVAKSASIITQSPCGVECGALPERVIPNVRKVVEWLTAMLERWRGVRHG